ncbi:DNA-processing protein DprA [Thaumasiovibrio subtropicus]|uniref:DNA-processing protein DprA n=1 Tax=Thaumasiovibrio subtropicus TaxID=1891207 RepID=UPI000B363908|nr:DNA-processing protein DprA [Thaumasiovibrio subtropicus]
MIDNTELWVRLARVPRLGGQGIQKLCQRIPFSSLWSSDDTALRLSGLSDKQLTAFRAPLNASQQHALRWLEADNHHLIHWGHPDYPYLLSQIASPPPVLFVAGEVTALSKPQLAMVGSRQASIDGREAAYQFAAGLVIEGYTVTSGLALGIDGCAHQGALEKGGQTIAVLGSGLSKIYPAAHRELAKQIQSQGALVSEFFPDTAPRPSHFPRRNRIISGLSVGVFVVEAAEKSGSLITVKYALEQNRDVFALPGSIYNPQSKGCNQLIKSGAKLVETPVDIIEEVGVLTDCTILHQSEEQSRGEDNQQLPFAALLDTVGSDAIPVDVIAGRCQLPVHEVMMQLLELELQGQVTAVPGGYVRTRRGK